MSYILEALKKLENSRKQAGTLTLSASEALKPQASKARRLLPYLVLAALVLNGAALLWWMAPWRTAGPAQVASPPAAREAAGPRAAATNGPGESAEKGNAPSVREPGENPKRAAGQTAVAEKGSPAAKTNGHAQKAVREPASKANALPGAVAARPDESPREAPEAIPGLKMSLHYYAPDPKSRFVRINERNLREGETTNEGAKVEQITEGGVVMSFKGRRFQIGIDDNH